MQHIEIHFKGRINPKWQEWFGDFTISQNQHDDMVLSGIVTDQAALYGVISHLRDLGLELISVSSSEVGQKPNEQESWGVVDAYRRGRQRYYLLVLFIFEGLR